MTLPQRQADTVGGMFGALGRLVSRRPWWVIAGWIVTTVLLVLFAPSVDSTTDQADFLPDKYESIKATKIGRAHV